MAQLVGEVDDHQLVEPVRIAHHDERAAVVMLVRAAEIENARGLRQALDELAATGVDRMPERGPKGRVVDVLLGAPDLLDHAVRCDGARVEAVHEVLQASGVGIPAQHHVVRHAHRGLGRELREGFRVGAPIRTWSRRSAAFAYSLRRVGERASCARIRAGRDPGTRRNLDAGVEGAAAGGAPVFGRAALHAFHHVGRVGHVAPAVVAGRARRGRDRREARPGPRSRRPRRRAGAGPVRS